MPRTAFSYKPPLKLTNNYNNSNGMRRTITTCFAIALASLAVMAQNPDTRKEMVINTEEDPSDVTTIADIIRIEEDDNGKHSIATPCDRALNHNSYIKVGFNLSKLVPKYAINIGTGYNYDLVPPFKSDWGAALQIGHRYTLHRNPVAGMLWFNVDATYADLSINHFKAESGEGVYSSTQTWTHTDANGTARDFHFIPWCLEKYETNVGMSVGPSVSLDFFRENETLRNLTFNVFYHIGYHASLMWMQNDIRLDASQSATTPGTFNPVNDNVKMTWGHGFMNSFGIDVNWRSIGIGVEKRYGYLEYQSLQRSIYGSSKYKFIDDALKVFLQIRF